jgi:hypothetical protein
MATTLPIAERAALTAICTDSEDPWAHHALGCVCLYTRRFDDSLAEFELALRLNPNFSLRRAFMAWHCPIATGGKRPTGRRAGRFA